MVLQTVRKHSGKSRNCSLRAISAFPIVFSKDLYCRHVKTQGLVWEMDKDKPKRSSSGKRPRVENYVILQLDRPAFRERDNQDTMLAL